MSFCILTIARNESKYVTETIENVLKSNILPTYWLFLNDNSQDNTLSILKRYEHKYNFIHVINIGELYNDNNYGSLGRYTIYGLMYLRKLVPDLKMIIMLDSDTLISKKYFQVMLDSIDNGNYGILSGVIYEPYYSSYVSNGRRLRGCALILTKKFLDKLNFSYLPISSQDTYLRIKNISYGLKENILSETFAIHTRPTKISERNPYHYGYFMASTGYDPFIALLWGLNIFGIIKGLIAFTSYLRYFYKIKNADTDIIKYRSIISSFNRILKNLERI